MIGKIKEILKEFKNKQKYIVKQNDELLWASVFHDSIRGKKSLEELPLNIGRWAGNYSLFYVLNRILNDYKPQNIIELGLGESSKFVSTYLDHYLTASKHLIIEHDPNWKSVFENNFKLSSRSSIDIKPLVKKKYKNFEYNGYENIETEIDSKFDLYLIDGPFGSPNYSRFDVYNLAEKLTSQDDFIIIMDDYHRIGERETTDELLSMFEAKNIKIYSTVYKGLKSVKIIATEKYKYISSL
jgi:hypothetical protein